VSRPRARCRKGRFRALLLAFALLRGAGAQEAKPAEPKATAPETATSASSSPESVSASSSGFDLDKLPFIPIPEIDTAPFSGVTLGLIPVMLSNNANGEIDKILAPDIIHSQYFGWGARWRIFRNPSEDEKWSVVAGAKQYVEREFDAQYNRGLLRDTAWSWSVHAVYDRSGTGRFFGLGNETPYSNQTTYVNSQVLLEATVARNFTHALQLSYMARADSVEIEQSALDSLPATTAVYPNQMGVGDVSEVLQQRLILSYDTRDSVIVPHMGERLVAFAGFSTRALGSSDSYTFLGVDATHFQPVGKNLTLVAHAALRYMPTYTDAPFWALSSLGGDRSVIGEAQPLRAFGAARYIDNNSFAASVEARAWVRSFHFFGTDLKLELAPFVDSGKVFPAMSNSPLSQLHVGGGMGFRLVASPFIVGYLDVGFGSQGVAVFSGIDYPF